jgi:arylsulfatase A
MIDPKLFMKQVLKLVPVLAMLICQGAAAQKKRPNIVLIVADDLGYADLSCYGQQRFTTPNIDKMALDGKRFTQFYSGSTVCAPARASLMTGLHTGHTPIRGNRSMEPEGQYPLPEGTQTITWFLQQAGYTTGAFGKWGLGGPESSGEPTKNGFDQFYGYVCQTLAHNYYPSYVWYNRQKEFFPSNEQNHTIYSADTIHGQAKLFLNRQSAAAPFFMYLPYTIPHGDVMVPHDATYESFKKRFNEQPEPRPASKPLSREHEEYPHAGFAAMVTRLDKYVGEILEILKKKGLAENTLVIFTSDNGPHRENGGDPEFFDNNGPYRGIKRDLYEGGIRVPFIAYWPGTIKAGTLNDEPLVLYDLFPTFQKLAGVPVSKNIDGISIVDALKGDRQSSHKYLYWEFHEQGGKQAVRLGPWKGIRLDVSLRPDSPVELYNLEKDPNERTNVANQHPEIARRIGLIMKEAHKADNNWPLLVGEKNL